jgi:hypothetical protein
MNIPMVGMRNLLPLLESSNVGWRGTGAADAFDLKKQ